MRPNRLGAPGNLPFRGEHEAAMMYSILHEQPDQVQKYVPEISAACESIIAKALEKNPEERYQSAADMVADLRRWKRDSSGIHRRLVEPPMASDCRFWCPRDCQWTFAPDPSVVKGCFGQKNARRASV